MIPKARATRRVARPSTRPTRPTPTNATPVTFWSSTGSQQDIVVRNFEGLIDYSRYSPNINGTLPTSQQDKCTDVPVRDLRATADEGLGPPTLEQRGAV